MVIVFYVLFLLCLFFVKQKTAYEVRISDWSSDVCSSDLVVDDRQQMAAAFMDVAGIVPVALGRRTAEHLRCDRLGEAEDGVQRRAKLVAHQSEEQIGRASRRERGCQ